MESDYIRMGDSRRPTPSQRLNAYCTVIIRVSYGYEYTRGSGRVWVEIFGAGRVRVRVASSATGTGRVAEMVDPHTPIANVCVRVRGRVCVPRSIEFYSMDPDASAPLCSEVDTLCSIYSSMATTLKKPQQNN